MDDFEVIKRADRQAMRRVIDYIWYEEMKDYNAHRGVYPGVEEHHIFVSIRELGKAIGYKPWEEAKIW